jgi:hypothetical protein
MKVVARSYRNSCRRVLHVKYGALMIHVSNDVAVFLVLWQSRLTLNREHAQSESSGRCCDRNQKEMV